MLIRLATGAYHARDQCDQIVWSMLGHLEQLKFAQ